MRYYDGNLNKIWYTGPYNFTSRCDTWAPWGFSPTTIMCMLTVSVLKLEQTLLRFFCITLCDFIYRKLTDSTACCWSSVQYTRWMCR